MFTNNYNAPQLTVINVELVSRILDVSNTVVGPGTEYPD